MTQEMKPPRKLVPVPAKKIRMSKKQRIKARWAGREAERFAHVGGFGPRGGAA